MKRYTRALALALALLLVLLMAAGCGGKETEAETPKGEAQEETAPQEEKKLSDTLTYSDGKVVLHFTMGEDEHWKWRDDVDFPLNEEYVTDLVDAVEEMMEARPISKAKKYNKYGLDSKDKYLTAVDEKGESITFYFGDKHKDGRLYMRREGEKGKVYLAPKLIGKALGRSIYDMMKLPELPVLTEENIRTIVVNGPEEKFTVKNSGGTWKHEGKDVSRKLDGLLAMLGEMKIDRCIDYRPSKGVDKLCGLRSPRAIIRVEYTNTVGTDATFRMEVGDIRDEGRYVRFEDDSTIYLMARKSLQPLFTLADHGI